ncbi:MAG: ATP-binding cassette domain-containing protein [Candidatus Lokiarchaeota archaeon]|nr:ATP-binding cassette domain-containing protein [Candidatus Lokiarchaeota archaeon]MBD3202390.1 ATP-binding cassette domain-containing protein [Candidatus Lokiarchaeota archaeon]
MLLELNNLTIPTFDKRKNIVEKISLDVQKGSIHAIIGPNGSGKSTIAYSIMGLENYQPSEGEIIFEGENITELGVTERAQRGITLAWQEPARIEGLSVLKYIALGIKDKSNLKKKVIEALKTVNLEPKKYINRFIDESLSGGERKRIELAATIAMRPKLILLDEPDAGLDMIVIEDFLNIFNKIKELDMTILLITHREDIGMVADRGTLVWQGMSLITDKFAEVMLRYCAKAGLKEFCKRTLFEDTEKCFDEDYIDKIFAEENSK